MPENISYPWYAVRVKSRHENTVASHLHARGYQAFLPLYKSRNRWSDRFKEIELPLFPGYIDETEIAAIQATVKSGLPSQPWPFLQIGHRVRIEHGPLCGIEGILLGFRGHQRLVLSVTLLQRSVAVQVDGTWVLAMSQQRSASSSPANPQGVSWQPTA